MQTELIRKGRKRKYNTHKCVSGRGDPNKTYTGTTVDVPKK